MTESDQSASCFAYSSASGNPGSAERGTDRCIGWKTATAPSWTMSASYVSMDEDGFTIDVKDANSAVLIGYKAQG